MVLSRERTNAVGSVGTTPAIASLAVRSRPWWSSSSAGMPNQAARTARWAAGISSTALPTLSSRATTVPASTVASSAAPAATPAAASSAVGIRRAILIAASRRGAAEPAERVHDSTLPPARARDHSSCFACG
jgi:hypothetical protein